MIQLRPAVRFDRVMLEAVCERHGIRSVVLFGSHATGSPPPDPDSDLDLAITLDAGMQTTFWKCSDELANVFPEFVVDLVGLRDADPLFRWEILHAGILLYGNIDEFLELRAFAYRDFVDSADLRALERTLSERKLARVRELLRAAT